MLVYLYILGSSGNKRLTRTPFQPIRERLFHLDLLLVSERENNETMVNPEYFDHFIFPT